MLITAFSFKLNTQIQIGSTAIGKFNGKHPSFVCATTGGKVLIHSPHDIESADRNTSDDKTTRYLNFNRKITCVSTGCLQSGQNKDQGRDYLFIGSNTSVLAYDVERNADLFFNEIQDGVSTILVGGFGPGATSMVLAGGNCSLFGFDISGNEIFWTVTGDNVSSVAICDYNFDGIPNLLVGTDDFELRVYRNEEIIEEISEADKVVLLKSLRNNNFAYGLANGTVGVYCINKRLWRVKTKNQVTALNVFDINGDGIDEILIGWSNGTFHVRNSENGEVLFKEKFNSAIAGIVVSDYRMDGKENIMVCCESGEIKAYLPADAESIAVINDYKYTNASSYEDNKAISELQDKKQEIINELRSIERTLKLAKSTDTVVGGLLSDTALNYNIFPDLANASLSVKIEPNNEATIVNVVALDSESSLLDNCEILALTPLCFGKPVSIPFKPTKYCSSVLRLQTHVAARGSINQLHVFEKDIKIPKFAAFMKLPETGINGGKVVLGDVAMGEPSAFVNFRMKTSIVRLVDYINNAFILPSTYKTNAEGFRIQFISVIPESNSSNFPDKYRQPLMLSASRDESSDSHIKIQVKCDSIDLASELVQDMAKFLNIQELSSEINFPREFQELDKIVAKVTEQNTERVSLVADMADDTQLIKAMIVRAEDSRLLMDMKTMRRSYIELFNLNNKLISSCNARSSNHNSLINNLKSVNTMIQKTSNLRVGKASSQCIADCRSCVKSHEMTNLSRIMRQGFDGRNTQN